jgi:hypothetical protein
MKIKQLRTMPRLWQGEGGQRRVWSSDSNIVTVPVAQQSTGTYEHVWLRQTFTQLNFCLWGKGWIGLSLQDKEWAQQSLSALRVTEVLESPHCPVSFQWIPFQLITTTLVKALGQIRGWNLHFIFVFQSLSSLHWVGFFGLLRCQRPWEVWPAL